MSTDYQQARESLGLRLRELRLTAPDGRLTGAQLAERLGWPASKVSKLELGKQTATPEDLRQFTAAVGQPEAYEELLSRLRGFESQIRSWRRQLAAGHRPVQAVHNHAQAKAKVLRAWESSWVVGILQTPGYARAILRHFAQLHGSRLDDLEDAVAARMERQRLLYEPGRKYHIILSESVLRHLVCPPADLAAQLSYLSGVIDLKTVELGIVPFGASLKLPPGAGFWVYDDRQVVTETWHAELWMDDEATVATYLKAWKTLQESAVYGADAQNVINAASRALSSR
ncbi:helix-turn-helix transcriptional regulator [Streptomyces sp. NPDC051917]|uniref:helix-turn-helix domain-containing protein n=1 Tax=Streptomyces sp. NPDC051917 TaxID=3154754 RepID=UPI00345257A9